MNVASLCVLLPLGLGFILLAVWLLSNLSYDAYHRHGDNFLSVEEAAIRLFITAIPLITGIALLVKALS